MSDIKHPNEIDKLYNNNEISISEASKLRDSWENSTEEEKKENAIYTKSLENKAKKVQAKKLVMHYHQILFQIKILLKV